MDVGSLGPAAPPPAAFLLPAGDLLVDSSRYAGPVLALTRRLRAAVAATPAPTLLLGVGSQVDGQDGLMAEGGVRDAGAIAATASVALHSDQAALLRAVAASGGAVSVRGAFTAAVAAASGLPPPLALGCPSLFLNHAPALGAELQRKWDALLAARNASLRVAVTLPVAPSEGEVGAFPIARQLSLLVNRVLRPLRGSVVVLQTPGDTALLQYMNDELGFYLPPTRVRWYYDVDAWVAGLRSCCDTVFGFRAHGALAGVAAGLPSVALSQDRRVRELADAMALPTVDWAAPGPLHARSASLFDILEDIGFDGGAFDARRRALAREYQRVFGGVGVPIHPGLAALADGADE